ncbi:MAG TPA: MarR family transcriptional regulator [Terriglobales bacterium]|nr:MarR family transcriptional regulator [Terriglobales bacterium]
MSPRAPVSQPDYQAMAEFRYQIRRFLRFSEGAARQSGLEPQQYLLLLALKGLPDGRRGRIGEIAERLQIQHHSTVELVDRLEKRGMVRRQRSDQDRREVLLELTPRGDKVLRDLALYHREELRELAPGLVRSLKKAISGAGRSARRS